MGRAGEGTEWWTRPTCRHACARRLLNVRSSRTAPVQRSYLARLDLPHAGQEKGALILLHAFVVQLAKLPGGHGSEKRECRVERLGCGAERTCPHRKKRGRH